jgi:DNA-binding response OmpR family regulator
MMPGGHGVGGRILVVDDDELVAAMFQRYLTSVGFVADTAVRLDEAIEKFSTARHAVVLADLRLVRGSDSSEGIQLVRRIREISRLTIVIVLTAFADAKATQDALAAGADRVLQKPQPLRDLTRIIAELFASRSALAPSASRGQGQNRG